MALIFLGSTKCVLCDELLLQGEKVSSLPPISDITNPLYKYFDAGLHTQCFENWDKKEEVLKVIKEENQKFINSDFFRKMVSKYGEPEWLDDMERGFPPYWNKA